jgi:hypothetical protein
MAEEIFYSALHWAKKAEKAFKSVEELTPLAQEAANKAFWGNIGDIKYTARTTVPNGGAWCDGSTYAKADFEAVYKMLTEGTMIAVDMAEYDSLVADKGSCGFFGLDTATETFKVPTLSDVFVKAGQEAATFGDESLPNIKGAASQVDAGVWWRQGAFYFGDTIGDADYAITGTASSNSKSLYLNASNSSPTYQDGAKVNPDHVKYRAYIVLFTAEKELSVVDWTNRINEVAEERMDELRDAGLTTIKYWE